MQGVATVSPGTVEPNTRHVAAFSLCHPRRYWFADIPATKGVAFHTLTRPGQDIVLYADEVREVQSATMQAVLTAQTKSCALRKETSFQILFCPTSDR
ncbi:MAG: hypothetical protein WDA00_02280 [Eubacteriales bacterium]